MTTCLWTGVIATRECCDRLTCGKQLIAVVVAILSVPPLTYFVTTSNIPLTRTTRNADGFQFIRSDGVLCVRREVIGWSAACFLSHTNTHTPHASRNISGHDDTFACKLGYLQKLLRYHHFHSEISAIWLHYGSAVGVQRQHESRDDNDIAKKISIYIPNIKFSTHGNTYIKTGSFYWVVFRKPPRNLKKLNTNFVVLLNYLNLQYIKRTICCIFS